MSPSSRPIRAALVAVLVILGLMPAASAYASPRDPDPTHPDPTRVDPNGSTATARARNAADVLMASYDQQKAWFPSSWWNSAVSLQTIGDYMERTGDRRYLDELDHTFETNKGPFPAGELSTDEIYGNFTSRAIDDAGWWALNWIQAYDLTGKEKYLDMAVTIAEFMSDFWDPSTCGGGIWWNEERTYKNAVTNGQWVRLTAELHNRIPGDSIWLQKAVDGWDWYLDSGLINSHGLVNDGLDDDCANNGQTVISYNQGLAIGAALELWRATGDRKLLGDALWLADSALASDELITDGVLTDECDAPDRTCSDNGKQFKGIFMRYLMELADSTGNRKYQKFVTTQANTIWERDRDVAGRLGTRWLGIDNAEHPNAFDWRTQASALSALIAEVPERGVRNSLSATMSPAQPVVMPGTDTPTELGLDLGLQATGHRGTPLKVKITIDGPDGWSIAPDRERIRLRLDGVAEPTEKTVPIDVTVPAGAEDGTYTVTATVQAGPHLEFTATSEVVVASTIDFDTGTAAELPWLFDADGSSSSGPQSRFADGGSYFVYRFPFPAGTTAAEATMAIDNQYLVQASSDGENWTTELTEEEPVQDGSNKADQTIDLSSYLGSDTTVYLKVSDSFPEDGWGGRVSHVSADFTR